jgi:hypothetical protein
MARAVQVDEPSQRRVAGSHAPGPYRPAPQSSVTSCPGPRVSSPRLSRLDASGKRNSSALAHARGEAQKHGIGGHGHGRAGKAEELQRQTWRGTEAWEGGHGRVCLSRFCLSLPLPPEGPLSSPMRPRACPLDWKFFRELTGVQSVVEKQHSVTRGTETSRARTCLPTPCLSSPNDWWSRRARRGRRSRQAGLAAHRASTTVGS